MSVESTILASITLSAPEMILAVGALFLLMVGVFAGEKSSEPVSWLAVLVIIFAGGWILFNPGEGQGLGIPLQLMNVEKPGRGSDAVIDEVFPRQL